MERQALITNVRLRHSLNRYARYVAVCQRHVKSGSGMMQLNWLLSVANSMRKQAILSTLVHNRNRLRSIEHDMLAYVECSCEIWTDLYYTRAFEGTKDLGPKHSQRAKRVLRTSQKLLEQIRAESLNIGR